LIKVLVRRFFADFLVVLSKRVNPHPNEKCDEDPFIFSWEQREKMKNNQVRIPSSSPGNRERR
jgi:hypothetical protein